jgi:hypothetical protein
MKMTGTSIYNSMEEVFLVYAVISQLIFTFPSFINVEDFCVYKSLSLYNETLKYNEVFIPTAMTIKNNVVLD